MGKDERKVENIFFNSFHMTNDVHTLQC